ncbi:MAG: hypothetical protein JXR07_14005 [Reichenbachiella sp.]
MKEMKKVGILTMLLLFTLIIFQYCSADDVTPEVCNAVPVNCTTGGEIQACCDGTSCHYEWNGDNYPCDGDDCTDAALEVTNLCLGL